MTAVRVFIACSLDGFIAGPNDELDWLAGPAGAEDTFTPFFAQIGAMLMGRRTYDVVDAFEGVWPYGDTPVLVATRRPLTTTRDAVRAVDGTIAQQIDEARAVAGGRDVYLDGGCLIRDALDANLLGEGIPLFAGAGRRHALDLVGERSVGGGLVELQYRPRA